MILLYTITICTKILCDNQKNYLFHEFLKCSVHAENPLCKQIAQKCSYDNDNRLQLTKLGFPTVLQNIL